VIGKWPLWERLQAIPQYYLTGYSGGALGHRIELLVALPILAGLGLGLWRMLERPHPKARRGVMMAVAIAAGGILIRSCSCPSAPTTWRPATWSRR
jgi:hypothetical protein